MAKARKLSVCGRCGIPPPAPSSRKLRVYDGKSCVGAETRPSDSKTHRGKPLQQESCPQVPSRPARGYYQGRHLERCRAVQQDRLGSGQECAEGRAPQKHGLSLQKPVACPGEGSHPKSGVTQVSSHLRDHFFFATTGPGFLSAGGGGTLNISIAPSRRTARRSPSSESAKFCPPVRMGDAVVAIKSSPVAESKTCTSCSRTSSSLSESTKSMKWLTRSRLTAKRPLVHEYAKLGHTRWPSRCPVQSFFPSLVHASR